MSESSPTPQENGTDKQEHANVDPGLGQSSTASGSPSGEVNIGRLKEQLRSILDQLPQAELAAHGEQLADLHQSVTGIAEGTTNDNLQGGIDALALARESLQRAIGHVTAGIESGQRYIESR